MACTRVRKSGVVVHVDELVMLSSGTCTCCGTSAVVVQIDVSGAVRRMASLCAPSSVGVETCRELLDGLVASGRRCSFGYCHKYKCKELCGIIVNGDCPLYLRHLFMSAVAVDTVVVAMYREVACTGAYSAIVCISTCLWHVLMCLPLVWLYA